MTHIIAGSLIKANLRDVTEKLIRLLALFALMLMPMGMGVATLAPRAGMRAAVPPLRPRPVLHMEDMGIHMGDDPSVQAMAGMDHSAMGHSSAEAVPAADDHGAMNMRDGCKVTFPVGVGVDMIAPMPMDRTGHPGIGLDKFDHRVLTYRDLVALKDFGDQRPPTRRMDIHLTGNMERYMWSMDGEKLSENPEPYRFERNERLRMRLINDTMMTHPMHIHGHYWQLANGQGVNQPLKHTMWVLPGSYVDLDLTADAPAIGRFTATCSTTCIQA